MKDFVLCWIERTANRIGVWAYSQKVKAKENWSKGYRKWKDDYPKKGDN
jgi:hypothetical protein